MKTLLVAQILDGSVYDRETEIHVAQYVYQVEKVTNSLTPSIGARLSFEDTNKYCEDDTWNVTIK